MSTLSPQETLLRYYESSQEQNTTPNMRDVIDLFRANSSQSLHYYSNWPEVFMKHFDLNAASRIKGVKMLVQEYMDSTYGKGDTRASSGSVLIDVAELGRHNTYVKLPRADHDKTLSTFIPLKDLYRGGQSIIFNDIKIETFHRYDFQEFTIIGPRDGGTHRTIGLCLSYGLIYNKTFRSHGYDITTAKAKALTPLAELIRGLLSVDAEVTVVGTISKVDAVEFVRGRSSFEIRADLDELFGFIGSEQFQNIIDSLLSLPYHFQLYGNIFTVRDTQHKSVAKYESKTFFGVMPFVHMAAELEGVRNSYDNSWWFERFVMRVTHRIPYNSFGALDINTWFAQLGGALAVKSL